MSSFLSNVTVYVFVDFAKYATTVTLAVIVLPTLLCSILSNVYVYCASPTDALAVLVVSPTVTVAPLTAKLVP